MNNELICNYDLLGDQNFMLNKSIWDMYDMKQTRINVIDLIEKYKVAVTICINSTLLLDNCKAVNLDPNKVFNSCNQSKKDFTNMVDKYIEAENLVKITKPIIEWLTNTFNPKEKKYYNYCIANNYSEEYIREILGGISKNDLLPIKNSCLLKIALAFKIAVLKK